MIIKIYRCYELISQGKCYLKIFHIPLNNPERLICHKTKKPNQIKIFHSNGEEKKKENFFNSI